jgi:transposase
MDMMPSKYGSYKTVWERHKKKWSEQGIWKNIRDSLISHGYQKGVINVTDLSMDSSTVPTEWEGQEIGYNDGHNKKTKGSKIHALVTYTSLPVTIDLGPGNEQHGSRRLITLLKNIRIRSIRRPRNKPKRVYADNNKYHTPSVMMYLAGRGIAARIKERVNRKKRPGRPRLFDYDTYSKIRSSVERFFGWIKSFRRIQTRYDRLASTYLGFLQLGCVMILMRKVFR